jgi:hypothetical protein
VTLKNNANYKQHKIKKKSRDLKRQKNLKKLEINKQTLQTAPKADWLCNTVNVSPVPSPTISHRRSFTVLDVELSPRRLKTPLDL